jgi:hypothetical protein
MKKTARPLAELKTRSAGMKTEKQGPAGVGLTKFTKVGGVLTKKLWLAPKGTLVSDGSACLMSHGTAERVRVASVGELAALIAKLCPSQAIALGTLRAGLPDKVEVTTEKKLNGVARPDIIARTGANIIYQGPAFALLDFDTKGMPPEVTGKLKQIGGFWSALLTVLPTLSGVAHVTRRSTSAGLFRADTGKPLRGSDGLHVYVEVTDGGDIERFLRTLHDRCWLAGLGWMMVSASGALLERSIVDRMVGGPERLVFEGGPILKPPLKQDRASRRPVAVDGEVLDTVTACPPLSIVETAKLEELKARERQRLAPEVAKARSTFIGVQAKRLAERTSKPEQDARKIIERECEGVLHPDVLLQFDDKDLSGCTVGDVLADPARFEGETLADPLEGVDYGRCVAKIMRRGDGTPWIHSFAHGRTIYELKLNAASVRKAMEEAGKNDVAKTFCRLIADADLDPEDLEELRQLTKKLSGVGLGVIDSMLTAARQKHNAKRADETRNRQQAARHDPRPMIAAPLLDGPFLPVMDVLNDVIGKVNAALPPLRDIDGITTRVRKLPIPNMHAFTQSEANAEQQGTTHD